MESYETKQEIVANCCPVTPNVIWEDFGEYILLTTSTSMQNICGKFNVLSWQRCQYDIYSAEGITIINWHGSTIPMQPLSWIYWHISPKGLSVSGANVGGIDKRTK